MDDLERTATATVLTFIAALTFLGCAFGVVSLWLYPTQGGMAALGPVVVRLLLSFAALIVSVFATVAATFFRRRSAWMMLVQIPGLLFFAWLWWQM